MSSLEALEVALNGLVDYKEKYIVVNGVESVSRKEADMKQKALEVLDKFNLFEANHLKSKETNKAKFWMLKGKLLNVGEEYCKEAEDVLGKSVKLEPHLVEGWTQLGECFWKKRDLSGAKNCFLGALKHNPDDKVALRCLSMILRQHYENPKEHIENVQESVVKAKKAVEVDLEDGTSWYILGNAYLSLFFATSQDNSILKKAMSAYEKAAKNPVTFTNPDLHYNRAMAFKYQEEFEQALNSLGKASALDPQWDGARAGEMELLNHLQKAMELVRTKGNMKPNKLKNLKASIKDEDLGPFAGGSYTGPSNSTVKLEQVPLSVLKQGENNEKVVHGKVICGMSTKDPVPFTFILADKEGTCMAVKLYNISTGFGVSIGNSVAIADPYLNDLDFSYKGQHIALKSIRVSSPLLLVVNKKKIGIDKQVPTELVTVSKK